MDILENLLVETAIQGLELTGFEMDIQRQETQGKKTLIYLLDLFNSLILSRIYFM